MCFLSSIPEVKGEEEKKDGAGFLTLEALAADIDIFKDVTKFQALVEVAGFASKMEKKCTGERMRKERHDRRFKEKGVKTPAVFHIGENTCIQEKLLGSSIKSYKAIDNITSSANNMKRRFSCREDDDEWDAALENRQRRKKYRESGKVESDQKGNKKDEPLSFAQLPQNFKDKIIKEKQGTDVLLVIQKKITRTDMTDGHSRLSMPEKQTLSEFLTEEEKEALSAGGQFTVEIIEPLLDVSEIIFKRWVMRKEVGKASSSCFVFIRHWNNLKKKNKIEEGDIIQVWSFRVNGKLSFALVKIEEEQKEQENLGLIVGDGTEIIHSNSPSKGCC